jgi:hypothetical protein
MNGSLAAYFVLLPHLTTFLQLFIVNPPVTPSPPKLNSLSIKPTFSQEAHEYADIFMQYV